MLARGNEFGLRDVIDPSFVTHNPEILPMRLRPPATLIVLATLLAACGGTAASPSSSAASRSPDATGVPSASATASTSTSTDEPIPSDALADFSCELPIVEAATVARANITDVRVGSHADYDRVVFEFADGLPEVTLDRATPPFTHDASGMPIEVAGTSFLRLTLRGGTKQTLENTSSYNGPTSFARDFPTLVHLVEGGDFEAQSTWYLGLTHEACVRVVPLSEDGPERLVIDVEH